MDNVLQYILPEVVLLVGAAVLFVLGASKGANSRRAVPVVAAIALIAAFGAALFSQNHDAIEAGRAAVERTGSIALTGFSIYIKLISIGVAILFVLLAWPTAPDATGNRSISFGTETGEFFALLLLAISGMCFVASANSLPTLFLGIELASIPTYIMVTMSRPQGVAQEAGVKYFFLGAAAAALMLLGMSYLFGVTGEMRFDAILAKIQSGVEAPQMLLLAIVVMLIGFSFKLAAFPLHFYAGDVYQGAATPVTAAISFIPKVSGVVAILKILHTVGGSSFTLDPKLVTLLWILAVLTMSVGNVLGLLQYNVKRVLAYSSIAHSGYLLAGIATLVSLNSPELQRDVLAAILFYLLAYGIMNTGVFGVLMLLPGRAGQVATTAETYDDLAGAGRNHPLLGLAMTAGCLSLIGVPATAGFFGKLYIVMPAVQSGQSDLIWLAILTMINATVSAGYYLKIVGMMWSRKEPHLEGHLEAPASAEGPDRPLPVVTAVALSVAGLLAIGVVLPLAGGLYRGATEAVLSLR